MVIAPGVESSIMNFAHMKLPRRMPCITIPGVDMFVRGHNDFNDSRQKGKVTEHTLHRLDAAGEAKFLETFGIDVDTVRRLYRAP